jgi:hypothetical protein
MGPIGLPASRKARKGSPEVGRRALARVGGCLLVRAPLRGGQRPVAIPSSVRPPHQARSARGGAIPRTCGRTAATGVRGVGANRVFARPCSRHEPGPGRTQGSPLPSSASRPAQARRQRRGSRPHRPGGVRKRRKDSRCLFCRFLVKRRKDSRCEEKTPDVFFVSFSPVPGGTHRATRLAPRRRVRWHLPGRYLAA